LYRLVSSDVSGRQQRLSQDVSVLLMVWGQFVDHDITHVPVHDDSGEAIDCCARSGSAFSQFASVECFPIPIPANDRVFRISCMNFARSQTAPRLDCFPGPSEQINQITHWLDGSNIYGSDDEEAAELRAFVGGRLASRQSSFSKELLPDNPNDSDCQSQTICFLAGTVIKIIVVKLIRFNIRFYSKVTAE
jgi:peroxidase